MQDNNPDLGYCFPEEGVNLFYDAMCVPKCTQNKKGAEAFINFMQEPQVALANQEYIYYASPNLAVRQNEDNSLYGNPVVYPKVWPKGQYFTICPRIFWSCKTTCGLGLKAASCQQTARLRTGAFTGRPVRWVLRQRWRWRLG